MTVNPDRALRLVRAFVAAGLVVLAGAEPAFSQDDTPKPPAAQETAPGGGGNLDLSIGGGVIFAPRPYEGASAAIIPIPVVNVRYKRLFAEGIRGGYQFLQSGPLTGNAYLQANFEGLESTDSLYLEGMTNRRMSADAGAEIVYRARPVGFRFNVLSDVLGRNSGQEVSLQALTGAPLGRGSFLLAGIGPRWVSATRVDYYYGVSGAEARPGRPEYRGASSWNWDLSLGANVRLIGNWSLFALFSREAFGSAIENSPVVSGPAAYSMIASLTYRLK
jgi:outer membrane scaffolding protein for murein synthesis (MipA/OmpV family)